MPVPSLLGWLAILLTLLAGATARAADLPGSWVEVASDGGLGVRSIVAPGMACPKVAADGTALTSEMRGEADGDYPVQTCIAHAAAASRAITVDGLAAPMLSSDIKRIVVIGDTATPLLASAPWVMVRGNHEICSRGGNGWFRLLDPHPSADRCTDTTPPYASRIGSLSLVLFDGSDADDRNADPAKVASIAIS